MVQYQLKLILCKSQERELLRWIYHLTAVWNFAIRKIELNANNKVYLSKNDFNNILAGHGKKLRIPGHVIQGVLLNAHVAWQRCFKKIAGKPRLKGKRNKLNGVPFPDPIKTPKGNRISMPGIGSLRFHKMGLPQGRIKCGRIVKRSSGWYLSLCIDAQPKSIARISSGEIGIDPGFKHLLSLSNGTKIEHPRELEAKEQRIAQAQRGTNKKLSSRLHEKISNQRKDRNHKLSRVLVAENVKIYWSKDNHIGIATKFGKSVTSSSHGQLRAMLKYKSPTSGTEFIEVDPKFSTKTCSSCGSLSGPTGWNGLRVRQWTCVACGAEHDRDCNAAMNTLIAGAGLAHEMIREGQSEISIH